MAARSKLKKAVVNKVKARAAKRKVKLVPKGKGAPPGEVAARLATAIPNPRIDLDFENPWQLLIATILSAQSTDAMINKITPELFRAYPTPRKLAKADPDHVEHLVKSSGFFRNKAKAIRAASATVVEKFGGEVPRTMDEITEIPGVARKTGNVVLGCALGVNEGILVDTHVSRVAPRLGLTRKLTPEEIEEDLCKLFAREKWNRIGLRLQLHGRYTCFAKDPDCKRCPLNEICPSRMAPPDGTTVEQRAKVEQRRVESRGEWQPEGGRKPAGRAPQSL